jgi:hypothetical protein
MSMFDDLDLTTLLEDTGSEAEAQDQATETETSEEAEVDEQEAYKGYLRQSDYTKKTQEIAEARRELEAERATLQAQFQLLSQRAAPVEDDGEWVDPTERALIELRQELEQLRYEQQMTVAERRAQNDAGRAVAEFNLGVSPDELISWAATNKVYDLGQAAKFMSLEMKEVSQRIATDGRRKAAGEAALVGGASRGGGPATQSIDHSLSWGEWLAQAENVILKK